jgi:HlyD family secretion protein
MTRVLLVLLLASAVSGCSRAEPARRTQAAPRSVRFATVAERAIAGGLAVSGQLIAREEAAVAPQLSGYRIARVLIEAGQRVRAGQPLAVLDDVLLRADIAQQRAAVAQQRVAVEQAEAQAARVRGLEASGVLSAEAIAERALTARSARAQLAQAQAQLDAQTVRAALMIVRAPVGGRVLDRTARPGDVASTATVLFRLARDGEVELNAEIPEQSLKLVRIGDAAAVTLADGTQVTGRVRLVGAEIDAQTRLGRARILLPVRDSIRPGGFARATLQPVTTAARTVPATALLYGAGGASVTTIDRANAVRRVPVRIGRRGGALVELVEGPPIGTRVLVGAQGFVLDGDVVAPVAAR